MASNQVPASPNNTGGTIKANLVHEDLLQEIVTPATGPDLDIVAIHGLGGDSIKSWTDPDNHYMWLKDCLPNKFPTARIFTYGYTSSVWFDGGSPSIESEGIRLLVSLENVVHPKRLVVFICHSMGGILLKVAMVRAKAQDNKYGFLLGQPKVAMFMATPHLGSNIATYLDLLVKIPFVIERKNVKKLRSHSQWLKDLSDGFEERKNDFVTALSLFETKYYKGTKKVVVDEHSASLSWGNWRKLPINKDHSSICKFASENDVELRMIIPELGKIIDAGKKFIIDEQKLQQVAESCRYRNELEAQSPSPPSSHRGEISPTAITDRFDRDTSDPRGSAVSASSYYTPSSQFSNRSIEMAGDRTSPSTTPPPQSFDVSRYTKAMADARGEFVDKKYRTSYRMYQNLHDELHNHPSGGSSAGDQMSVLVYTASLGMARVCVKLYVLEEEGRVNCDDAVELEKITAFQKDDVNNAVKLLDTLRREGFPKLSQLDLAASDLGRGLCREAREFAKDVRSLDSYREELKRLLELAMEVKVFFEGRMDVVVR